MNLENDAIIFSFRMRRSKPKVENQREGTEMSTQNRDGERFTCFTNTSAV